MDRCPFCHAASVDVTLQAPCSCDDDDLPSFDGPDQPFVDVTPAPRVTIDDDGYAVCTIRFGGERVA